MHVKLGLVLCLAVFTLPCHSPVAAQEPSSTPQIGYDELAALGDSIDERKMLKDNVFLFRERSDQIRQQAMTLPGANIVFTVAVTRVTEHEVFLFVPDAGDTRIALKHDFPPLFGNLHTVCYAGSLSTQVAQILSKPMALRIGAQINPETAQRLRKGDLLVLRGYLETVHLLLDHVFQPRAIAVISQLEVRSVNSTSASKKYFYR